MGFSHTALTLLVQHHSSPIIWQCTTHAPSLGSGAATGRAPNNGYWRPFGGAFTISMRQLACRELLYMCSHLSNVRARWCGVITS